MPTVFAGTGKSDDADNKLTYGSDGAYYVPPESVDTVSYTCPGGVKKYLSDILNFVRTFAGCDSDQPAGVGGIALTGWQAVAAKTALVTRQLPDGTAVIYGPDALCLYVNTAAGANPASRVFSVPLHGTVNVTIDWGDNTSDTVTVAGLASHTYAAPGRYLVRITGTLTGLGVISSTGPDVFPTVVEPAGWDSLVACLSWGNLGITSLAQAFWNCIDLVAVPPTLPPGVTTLSHCFYGCTSFDQYINGWDVGAVTSLFGTFRGCTRFNQPLSSWQTSSVTNMSDTFNNCHRFNQPLVMWDVSKATTMARMFFQCRSFNQPLNGWDTSSVTSMNSMFSDCGLLNQPLALWKTGAVTDMNSMFLGCSLFNQPLGAWDVGRVTDFSFMFSGCVLLAQPFNTWNTVSATNMRNMFHSCALFNQPLSNWKTGSVVNMRLMFFGCSTFNQTLNAWDTSACTNMSNMFMGAELYNSPMTNWKTDNVTVMARMFHGADRFNQPLNTWNTAKCTDFNNMFTFARNFNQSLATLTLAATLSNNGVVDMFRGTDSFSTASYDATLVGWNNSKNGPPAWPKPRILNFFNAKTSTAGGGAAAKADLIAYGWTILDGGNV
jgi:surface protein